MRFLNKLLFAISTFLFQRNFKGFIEGHSSLDDIQVETIEQLLEQPEEKFITEFENAFSAVVGEGECISFAAGRMAFYSLLKNLGIGKGDEVLLTGFTCSVMADAVLKSGASIVYVDIDSGTLGTSASSVRNLLTDRTRMIVAQHSFGIPCGIREIASIAKENDIFLLEDCAIALGSSVNGMTLGNFGNAAIFSTDHSKPVNTFTGGLLYSRNTTLISEIREFRDSCGNLPVKKLHAIWQRIKIEKKFCNAVNYSSFPLREFISAVARKLSRSNAATPYLDEDQNLSSSSSYAYPAKFPSLLAYIGVIELENWAETSNRRKACLEDFINKAEALGFKEFLPTAYFNSESEIIPLRIVWSQPDGEKLRSEISSLVDTEQTWFLSPVISTALPLSEFGYHTGSCPNAESICPGMINIPVNLSDKTSRKLFDIIAA